MAEQQPLTTEQRLSALEQRFAAFERSQAERDQVQDTLNAALLQRIDGFIMTINRMDRDQLKMFQSQLVEFKALGLRVDALEQAIARRFGELEANLKEILADHKAGIERNNQEIQTVDQKIDQVLSLLLGEKPRQND